MFSWDYIVSQIVQWKLYQCGTLLFQYTFPVDRPDPVLTCLKITSPYYITRMNAFYALLTGLIHTPRAALTFMKHSLFEKHVLKLIKEFYC